MEDRFSRTQLMIGKKALESLSTRTVAVFGVGGVGGYVVEALARTGIGHFVLVDDDAVSISNINRQIIATTATVGLPKVDVAAQRILDINPAATVEKRREFYLPERHEDFDFAGYDYVVDAIDTVTAKIDIIVRCKELGVPVISAMGAGNKMNPTMLEVSDIYDTDVDPLARIMRHELRKRGVKSLKVVYSKEKPMDISANRDPQESLTDQRRLTPGSISFVPSVSGLIIASEVVKDLIGFRN